MKILALDPATKCGWAMSNYGVITYGVKSFAQKTGMSHLKFAAFHEWLSGKVPFSLDMTYVRSESPFVQRLNVAEILYGFKAIMRVHCSHQGHDLEFMSPSTLKLKATGYGRAKKARMMEVASEFVGDDITNDDEGDALCLLKVAMEELGVSCP